MEKNLFQQARDMVNNLMNMQGEPNQSDQEAAQNALKAAYSEASPEEQQQLKQLEQQLKQKYNMSE